MIDFVKKFIDFFTPPAEWLLSVLILLGILAGISAYAFHVSNASSYLSSRPETCINCHVMFPQYASWQKSSHAQVATCVDCHVPHDNAFNKYRFKMKDGLRHATIFTLRTEPQVIRIKEEGIAVVQENCLRCHSHVLQDTSIHRVTYHDVLKGEGKLCWECHREVPHGRTRSLSSTPHARVPNLPSVVPEWLEKIMPRFEE